LIKRSPGFAAVAILTLAIGIGANTAIFSVLDTLLLRPLPYPQSERLVQVSELVETGRPNSVSGGAFLDWREHQTQFDAIALTNPVAFNVRGATTTERLTGLEVSHEFFRVLGVPMRLGRGFLPDNDRPGGVNDVIVVTEELWRSHFGSDPDILGGTMVLDEVPHTIVGVFPAAAWLVRDHRFFVPAVLTPGTPRAERSPHWAAVFGRLRPDSSVAQADAELKAVKQRLTPLYPSFKAQWSVAVQPAADVIRGVTRGPVLVLLTAVSLVLLIACANVANLLIARGHHRQQELAVRTALGATSRRLLRQVLTESFVLASLGGVAGIVIASGGTALLRQLTRMTLPFSLAPSLDDRALLFALGATMVIAVLSARCRRFAPGGRTSAPGSSTAAAATRPGVAGRRRCWSSRKWRSRSCCSPRPGCCCAACRTPRRSIPDSTRRASWRSTCRCLTSPTRHGRGASHSWTTWSRGCARSPASRPPGAVCPCRSAAAATASDFAGRPTPSTTT
jgi:predicted permease